MHHALLSCQTPVSGLMYWEGKVTERGLLTRLFPEGKRGRQIQTPLSRCTDRSPHLELAIQRQRRINKGWKDVVEPSETDEETRSRNLEGRFGTPSEEWF